MISYNSYFEKLFYNQIVLNLIKEVIYEMLIRL